MEAVAAQSSVAAVLVESVVVESVLVESVVVESVVVESLAAAVLGQKPTAELAPGRDALEPPETPSAGTAAAQVQVWQELEAVVVRSGRNPARSDRRS